MKTFFVRLLRSASYRLKRTADIIDPPPPPPTPPPPPPPPPPPSEKELAHKRWVADRGDDTLRQEYPLTASDVVFDLGGYQGQWASDIHSRYSCIVHVFEPVPMFAHAIENRFAANDLVKVHRIAAGSYDGFLKISVADDASSVYVGDGNSLQIEIRDFCVWCQMNDVKEIGLLKINIEGGEYDLLEHLIATGFISRVRFIQVQFHDFVHDADSRMHKIQSELAKTHHLTYQYTYVWENWCRK